MTYLLLFYEFFKAGLFAVGGGLSTLPFLYEMAAEYPWFSEAELADMIAVSDSTPGPLGVNMATYAGFSAGGVPGAITATLALVLPAFLIMFTLSKILMKNRDKPLVSSVFRVLRPVVIGLISAAGYRVLEISVLTLDIFKQTGNILDSVNIVALIMLAAFLAAMQKIKLHPIVYIIIAAGFGIALKL